MGASIKGLYLMNCSFAQHGNPCADMKTVLELTEFSKGSVSKTKGNHLFPVKVGFNMTVRGTEDSTLFEVNALFGITYELSSKKDKDLLKDHVIISHAVPYLRELVSNLTMRSVFPPLWLAPVNTQELLKTEIK